MGQSVALGTCAASEPLFRLSCGNNLSPIDFIGVAVTLVGAFIGYAGTQPMSEEERKAIKDFALKRIAYRYYPVL